MPTLSSRDKERMDLDEAFTIFADPSKDEVMRICSSLQTVTDRTAEYFGYILQVLAEVESSDGVLSPTL